MLSRSVDRVPARFVILHHTSDAGEHWDLMLEHDQVLLTWQLPREPSDPGCLPLAARRIFDHPLRFLAYEGPLRRAPGRVRRVEAGEVELHQMSPGRVPFTLHGTRLRGSFELKNEEGDAWMLTSAEPC